MPVNFVCNVCQYTTNRKSNYERHLNVHSKPEISHEDNAKVCIYCHKEFCNKYVCKRHMESRCKHAPPKVTTFAPEVINFAQEVNTFAQEVINNDQKVTCSAFSCIKCKKTFSRKSNFQRHNLVCNGLSNSLQCPKCYLTMETKQQKYRHIKTCQGLKVHHLESIPGSSEVKVTAIPQTNNTVNNINAHTVNNANAMYHTVNVYVNNYGSENISHITNDVLDKHLKEINGNGLAKLIVDTHFNPDRPENHNIRMHNKTNKTLIVKENERWGIQANDHVLDALMTRYTRILKERMWESDYPGTLKYTEDYQQIQQDIQSIDKEMNAQKYYKIIHRIIAAMEELELQYGCA